MSSQNIFKGDRSQIANVDVDGPLANAEARGCEFYTSVYRAAENDADKTGHPDVAEVYRFLQIIASFHPSFDTPEQPFVPLMQMAGGRSCAPSDLTSEDIEAVRELSKMAKDFALRARLFDLLWESTNDHTQCAKAAESYIEAAERLNTPSHWVYSGECYYRGLFLAAKLGREKDLFKTASGRLQQAARDSASDIGEFRCCRFLELLLQFGCGDPIELAKIAAIHAKNAASTGNFYATRQYRHLEADLHKWGKNTEAEKSARLDAAEASVAEAENRAIGTGASFMAAAALMSKAIETLRQAGAAKERIEELRRRLNDWQQRSLAEFQSYSTSVDISKLISSARNHVKGSDFPAAALKLAFGQNLSDPTKIKEEVIQNAKQAPLSYLMGAAIVDQQGRTTALKESLFNLEGGTLEKALEIESFTQASHFHWPLRVDGFIEPARVQILNEHKPTFGDLLFIVRNNPFIPPGHEGIFLRGLHAGFHNDFLVASHLLIPQIENSLRYVLESHGVDVSNLMSDGTQPVKVLGAIFAMKETKQIFGEPLCFELRGCLIEKTGYDFRNRVAHGFVNEQECYSHAAAILWWLVLRICLMPVFQAIGERKKSPSAA